jgi:hypothetical protein
MNLTFIKEQKPEECYWSSFLTFKPINTALELVIYNNEGGYEREQLNWFYEIEKSYLKNEVFLFDFINQEIQRLFPLSKESYSRKNLSLSSIDISKEFNNKGLWELDFCTNNQVEHVVIEMNKWNPIFLSTWA